MLPPSIHQAVRHHPRESNHWALSDAMGRWCRAPSAVRREDFPRKGLPSEDRARRARTLEEDAGKGHPPRAGRFKPMMPWSTSSRFRGPPRRDPGVPRPEPPSMSWPIAQRPPRHRYRRGPPCSCSANPPRRALLPAAALHTGTRRYATTAGGIPGGRHPGTDTRCAVGRRSASSGSHEDLRRRFLEPLRLRHSKPAREARFIST